MKIKLKDLIKALSLQSDDCEIDMIRVAGFSPETYLYEISFLCEIKDLNGFTKQLSESMLKEVINADVLEDA